MIPKSFPSGTIVACDFVFGDAASRHRPRQPRVTRLRACARSCAETHELDIARGEYGMGLAPERPDRLLELVNRLGGARVIRGPDRGLLQKTQTSKLPNLTTCARTQFWSFCAGQRRIGPGQITDGTYKPNPSTGCVYFLPRCLPSFASSVEDPNTPPTTRRRRRPETRNPARS